MQINNHLLPLLYLQPPSLFNLLQLLLHQTILLLQLLNQALFTLYLINQLPILWVQVTDLVAQLTYVLMELFLD